MMNVSLRKAHFLKESYVTGDGITQAMGIKNNISFILNISSPIMYLYKNPKHNICIERQKENISEHSHTYQVRNTRFTCSRSVFSMRPFTILAYISLASISSFAVIIGVLIFLAALIISFILGTPSVTSITKLSTTDSTVKRAD